VANRKQRQTGFVDVAIIVADAPPTTGSEEVAQGENKATCTASSPGGTAEELRGRMDASVCARGLARLQGGARDVLESCVDRQENERRVDVREQRSREGYTGSS